MSEEEEIIQIKQTLEAVNHQDIDSQTINVFIAALRRDNYSLDNVNLYGMLMLARVLGKRAIEEHIIRHVRDTREDLFVELDTIIKEGRDTSQTLHEISNLFPGALKIPEMRKKLLTLPEDMIRIIFEHVLKSEKKKIETSLLLRFAVDYIKQHSDNGAFILSLIEPSPPLSNEDLELLDSIKVDWDVVSGRFTRCCIAHCKEMTRGSKITRKLIIGTFLCFLMVLLWYDRFTLLKPCREKLCTIIGRLCAFIACRVAPELMAGPSQLNQVTNATMGITSDG